mmetsp:Transcript_23277/g.77282  ORF Transcript_23277/g.77282 Transcript_23277/m.77282 type:complete len:83 (-) Transcript_23277:849-1097(-)
MLSKGFVDSALSMANREEMRAHLDTIRSGGRDTGTAERRLAQLQQERVAIFTHASNVLTTVFVLLIGAAVVIALHRSPQPVW